MKRFLRDFPVFQVTNGRGILNPQAPPYYITISESQENVDGDADGIAVVRQEDARGRLRNRIWGRGRLRPRETLEEVPEGDSVVIDIPSTPATVPGTPVPGTPVPGTPVPGTPAPVAEEVELAPIEAEERQLQKKADPPTPKAQAKPKAKPKAEAREAAGSSGDAPRIPKLEAAYRYMTENDLIPGTGKFMNKNRNLPWVWYQPDKLTCSTTVA